VVTGKKKHVLVLMGGQSGEHSISLRSAATVVRALGRAGYEVTAVAISKKGAWLLGDFTDLLERATTELVEVGPTDGTAVWLAQDGQVPRLVGVHAQLPQDLQIRPDVVFPILHGPAGEDGTMQGLLEVAGVPFVGAGCTASALAMDKLAMKTLCAGACIAQVEFLAAGESDADELAARIEAAFGFPCFVKPANLGSSVGISRVTSSATLADALAEARTWDRRVIIERAVDAREIEVAVLGNARPEISPPGEIIAPGGFYDFESKYVTDDAELIAGASVGGSQLEEIEAITRAVWDLTGCRGMARADFFIEKSTGRVLFNELNTIPGFTEISMYPRLWALAGRPIDELVGRLVELALDAQ